MYECLVQQYLCFKVIEFRSVISTHANQHQSTNLHVQTSCLLYARNALVQNIPWSKKTSCNIWLGCTHILDHDQQRSKINIYLEFWAITNQPLFANSRKWKKLNSKSLPVILNKICLQENLLFKYLLSLSIHIYIYIYIWVMCGV